MGGMDPTLRRLDVETARAADRCELLDLLLRSFRAQTPQHPAFDSLYPDLFQPTDECLGRHLIVRRDGHIAACAGVYPVEMQIGPCRLRVAGIGQVATDPPHRSAGLMTALMHAVRERIARDGYVLSWLGGRRDRYARFGWEKAGLALRIWCDARSAGPAPGGWEVSCRPAGGPVENALWVLRESQPVRALCSRQEWILRLGRGKGEIWTACAGDRRAFLLLRADGRTAQEWGGDPEGLAALIPAVAAGGGFSAVVLAGWDPLSRVFWERSAGAGADFANVLVADLPALFAAYAPILAERMSPRLAVRFAMLENGREVGEARLATDGRGDGPARYTVALDRLSMVRVLFGPVRPSQAVPGTDIPAALDALFPLPFIVPGTFHV